MGTMILFIAVPLFLVGIIVLLILYYSSYKKNKLVKELSKPEIDQVIKQAKSLTRKGNEFQLKLTQAGINEREYQEGRIVMIIIGIVIAVAIPYLMQPFFGVIAILIGVSCLIWGGDFYIMLLKSERREKIDRDLGSFLDLVNVILEAGGSLKNAFFTVSVQAKGIIDEELLKEIAILEYEMTNYGTIEAYENMKKRVDSDEMHKVIDFLILSEETGIGVKNIFATQSKEMRQEQFYKIKGKINTLNLYLMLVVFMFVFPAVGAFIVFPMQAGVISTGF
jgi:tight adherence protein C